MHYLLKPEKQIIHCLLAGVYELLIIILQSYLEHKSRWKGHDFGSQWSE